MARGAAVGAACGLAGGVAMAGASKVEQLATGRPDSYVPAHTLAHLLGLDHPFDQTLENLTGVGGPPWTQPRDELAIDLAEKGFFALVTGAFADALIEPAPTSTATKPGMGRRIKGRA